MADKKPVHVAAQPWEVTRKGFAKNRAANLAAKAIWLRDHGMTEQAKAIEADLKALLARHQKAEVIQPDEQTQAD